MSSYVLNCYSWRKTVSIVYHLISNSMLADKILNSWNILDFLLHSKWQSVFYLFTIFAIVIASFSINNLPANSWSHEICFKIFCHFIYFDNPAHWIIRNIPLQNWPYIGQKVHCEPPNEGVDEVGESTCESYRISHRRSESGFHASEKKHHRHADRTEYLQQR